MPLVSVIVPVYKVEKYLNKCVESLVGQTLQDIEIILIDDGSPDNCPKICDDWAKKDSRIKVIHQKNGGLASARNTGIKNATSEYISFVDSDDYLDLSFIEKLYLLIIKNSADISICNFARVYENGEAIHLPQCEIKDGTFTGRQICLDFRKVSTTYISACSKIYKKELFNEVSFPIGKINEDEAVAHKLIYPCKKVMLSSDVLYYYVNHNLGENISSSINEKNFTDAIEAFYDRVAYFNQVGDNELQEYSEMEYLYSIFVQMGRIERYSNIAKHKIAKIKTEFDLIYDQIRKNTKLTIKHKIILYSFKVNTHLTRIISRLGYKLIFRS